MSKKNEQAQSVLADLPPAKSIVTLAIPATLALLAKAVYNLVDTAYIGMLHSDIALTAVGVTVPLLLIMVSIENIFAAGAAVLAGRQLGARDSEGASRTVTTIIGISMAIGAALSIGGILFLEPLMRAFGASDASLATTVSQFVTFLILVWFYASGRSVIKIRRRAFQPSWKLIRTVAVIGIPTAVIQICLSAAASLTNIAAAGLPQSDEIIAAYGVVQRLILLFNQNPVIVEYGKWLLIAQPAADVLTILVCLCSVRPMKAAASRNMAASRPGVGPLDRLAAVCGARAPA